MTGHDRLFLTEKKKLPSYDHVVAKGDEAVLWVSIMYAGSESKNTRALFVCSEKNVMQTKSQGTSEGRLFQRRFVHRWNVYIYCLTRVYIIQDVHPRNTSIMYQNDTFTILAEYDKSFIDISSEQRVVEYHCYCNFSDFSVNRKICLIFIYTSLLDNLILKLSGRH